MFTEQKFAVAKFIDENVKRSPLTAAEIALECGFRSEKTLLAFRRAEIRLPLDKVAPLADAIECNKSELLTLVLKSWFPTDVVELLQTSLAPATGVLKGPRSTPSRNMVVGES
ncbi:hypothetical protein [Rhizobium sp. LjRoot254]|uniref:hypothetical protein n=1 Tax=Rhizobium sp. LjRoot254 TaxID=3342297 RepID=UPI003ECCC956